MFKEFYCYHIYKSLWCHFG